MGSCYCNASQEEEVLVETQTISLALAKPPRTSRGGRSYGGREERSGYTDLPLPPSPRTSGRSSREGRRGEEEGGGRSSREGRRLEEEGGGRSSRERRRWEEPVSESESVVSRQPRPPVRRRHRGKVVSERPKSAPPEKYSPPLLGGGEVRGVRLPDLSSGETSDTGAGTLETVSAKSINFVRPSQRLLEREQHKRLKRHKSFFSGESLFGKRPGMVRRAESFHQGGAGAREEARERAKSVDRLQAEEDPLVGRLIKSKSMEFLKTKILRRPSKATKKVEPHPVEPANMLAGRSMFELHRAGARDRPQADWPPLYPAPGGRRDQYRAAARPQPQPYDWRQDTPFWRAESREGRGSGGHRHSATPPPSWTPPPPQQWRAAPLPPSYPSVLAQAVNSSLYQGEGRMYLPPSPAPPPYSCSPGDALLEITELEDAPLGRDYSVYTHNPTNILEMPGGLY